MSRKIIVGVDDSAGAVAALRWAVEEARLRDDEVTVIHAYETPFYLVGMGEPTPVAVNQDMVVEAAKAVLDQIVDTAIGPGSATSTEGVKIQRAIAEGPAATVLREASEGADLLVVGTRGKGGFKELLLGSVSSQVVHHAPCPVVVVPSTSDEEAGEA